MQHFNVNGAVVVLLGMCSALVRAEEVFPPPTPIARFFQPPENYRDKFGDFRSTVPLMGEKVKSFAKDWPRRREKLRQEWHQRLGPWPPLEESPHATIDSTATREHIEWSKVRIKAGIDGDEVCGYLLKPLGAGPFPAVLVPYYEPESSVGLGAELRDFGLQLARRGFVSLSIGPPGVNFRAPGTSSQTNKPYIGAIGKPVRTQPLSALAFAAANCHTYLANQEFVAPKRIGIVGHSFGGKWAMFASCLYDKFACAVWCDAGIVFDERIRTDNVGGSINYWDEWYLGYELGQIARPLDRFQFRPVPKTPGDRTGSYQVLRSEGRDLTELHALMPPRPFLVSGGSADREERWVALNHTIAANKLLGHDYGVAMTNRKHHAPTFESNEQIYQFLEWSIGPRN
jgi:dienelactone hydrolase